MREDEPFEPVQDADIGGALDDLLPPLPEENAPDQAQQDHRRSPSSRPPGACMLLGTQPETSAAAGHVL